jgi:SnoaL-like domain
MALAAADFQQITEMFARVNFALDGLETECWVGCFTMNGSFEVSDASGKVISRYIGHDQLQDYMQRVADNPEHLAGIRHWNNGLHIEAVGDEIEVTSYLCIETTGAAHTILTTGVERDRFQRVGNVWLFQERRIQLDSK